MTRTARSALFLGGLALVLGGLASGHTAALALASITVGAFVIARSGARQPLPLAAAVLLLGLAIEVSVVAAPAPVDWPMLGAAGFAVAAAVLLLRIRGRRA